VALPGNPLTAGNRMDAKWSAAAGDLYQAWHLRPPGVLVARNAVDFARLTRRLTTSAWGPAPVLLLITLSALLASVALTLRPSTASLGAFLSADLGLLMVPCCTVMFAPPLGSPLYIVGKAGLRLAITAAAGFIAAWLAGGGLAEGSYIWTVALGLTGAAFLAFDLVAPVCHRRPA
jgi:hypothetical protein